MAQASRILATALITAASLFGHGVQAETAPVGHLRLIDRLDRPQDGCCLDILGTGQTLRLELPIFAHNCKPSPTPDSAISITTDGEIRFVEIDLCAVAFGVNGRALPGSPIVLRTYGDAAPFFDGVLLQQFEWTDDNRLRLGQTTLCLSVGHVPLAVDIL